MTSNLNLQDWDYLEIDDLPLSAKTVAEVLGFEDTKALMQVFPIEGVYIPKIEAIAETIIGKTIGLEKAQKLAKFYHGSTLFLHKTWACNRARNRKIREEAKTELSKAKSKTKYYAMIAGRENLSIHRVRQIISGHC